MSSISSSRKDRPNTAKDSDYFELRGTFAQQIAEWQEQMSRPVTVTTPAFYAEQRRRLRQMIEDDGNEPDEFSLWIGPMAEGEATEIVLNADGSIPPGTKIPRAGDVYSYFVVCTNEFRNVVPDRWVRFAGDGPTWNKGRRFRF